MSRASFDRAIPPESRILLDSSALIAYLNGGEPASEVAELLIDSFVRSARNTAVVSMVSVLEVLVRPLRRSQTAYHHVHDFLTKFPNLRLQPIDMAVAQEAASVRATQGLKTPDALVVASGLVAQVERVVTNDERWKSIKDTRLKVVYLADHHPL